MNDVIGALPTLVDDKRMWQSMEGIWSHSFYHELRTPPEDHPLYLIESPSNTRANRERTTMVMFESFNVPLLHMENSAVCSLYGSDDMKRKTGLVLESGHGITHVVPVVNGHALSCYN